MDRLIFFDTETTGLKAKDGDRLVEIGAVEAIGRVITKKRYHAYLNPERECSTGAFNVHKLTDKFLSKQAKFAEVADDFIAFIGDDTLVIHNADFDMGFINAELKRIKKAKLSNKTIDTVQLARGMVSGLGNYKLDSLADYFNIDRSHRSTHGAIIDAQLLAEVYFQMTRRQGGLDLQSFDHLGYAKKLKPFFDASGALSYKDFLLSANAIEQHNNMLAFFKAPHLWNPDKLIEPS